MRVAEQTRNWRHGMMTSRHAACLESTPPCVCRDVCVDLRAMYARVRVRCGGARWAWHVASAARAVGQRLVAASRALSAAGWVACCSMVQQREGRKTQNGDQVTSSSGRARRLVPSNAAASTSSPAAALIPLCSPRRASSAGMQQHTAAGVQDCRIARSMARHSPPYAASIMTTRQSLCARKANVGHRAEDCAGQ